MYTPYTFLTLHIPQSHTSHTHALYPYTMHTTHYTTHTRHHTHYTYHMHIYSTTYIPHTYITHISCSHSPHYTHIPHTLYTYTQTTKTEYKRGKRHFWEREGQRKRPISRETKRNGEQREIGERSGKGIGDSERRKEDQTFGIRRILNLASPLPGWATWGSHLTSLSLIFLSVKFAVYLITIH